MGQKAGLVCPAYQGRREIEVNLVLLKAAEQVSFVIKLCVFESI